MNPHVLGLKRRFVEELGRAALEYLEAGLDLFHRHLRSESASSRAAFENLAKSLELTIACVLAEKNLAAVFRDIPPQAWGLLSAPKRVPEFFRWRASPVNRHLPLSEP